MEPLIIGICGIKRSGSTVMYNLVRIALEMAGYKVVPFGHTYNPDRTPKEGEAYLVKRHPFLRKLANEADHIFLTDRLDEEILASLERFNQKTPHPGRIIKMREDFNKWKQYYNSYIFPYSEWIDNPIYYAEQILRELGLPVDAQNIIEEFNKIEPPESGQDSKTLLFHNHITNV